ncbi:MAG: restriction endonuclease [Bacteroidia bacterium]|nr:restriction endonuclease [Bacteroidia bacterium]
MIEKLTPTQLENLTLDLLQLLGLQNCVWRTPGRDGGRDIQGDSIENDFSGYTRIESWYVDCKKYSTSVSWPVVWEKLAYAESNSADVLLIVTSSSLSPQAIDEINRWNCGRKKPSVRFWNGTDLEKRLRIYPELLIKYGLSKNPVSEAAVSLLPLTKILMKYTNSAAAAIEFGTNEHSYYEVTHAVSELISARLEEVEKAGRPSTSPFRMPADSFLWLPDSIGNQLLAFDRCTIRTILCLLNCHGAAPLHATQVDGYVVLALKQKYIGSINDLEKVAFWGQLHLRWSKDRTNLELNNER